MNMTPVTSSNIAAMWYDLEKSELYIKFKNSKTFYYLDVTQEEYGRLINAESIGKHFNQFIKAVKVGREVATAASDSEAMSDKEKIKLLREALISCMAACKDEWGEDSCSDIEVALEATKDGE